MDQLLSVDAFGANHINVVEGMGRAPSKHFTFSRNMETDEVGLEEVTLPR